MRHKFGPHLFVALFLSLFLVAGCGGGPGTDVGSNSSSGGGTYTPPPNNPGPVTSGYELTPGETGGSTVVFPLVFTHQLDRIAAKEAVMLPEERALNRSLNRLEDPVFINQLIAAYRAALDSFEVYWCNAGEVCTETQNDGYRFYDLTEDVDQLAITGFTTGAYDFYFNFINAVPFSRLFLGKGTGVVGTGTTTVTVNLDYAREVNLAIILRNPPPGTFTEGVDYQMPISYVWGSGLVANSGTVGRYYGTTGFNWYGRYPVPANSFAFDAFLRFSVDEATFSVRDNFGTQHLMRFPLDVLTDIDGPLVFDWSTGLVFNIVWPTGPTDPNSPPTNPVITGPASGTTNQSLAFSGSASDPNGDPLVFTWNWGDGGTATGQSVSHAWSVAGTYTVSMTVSDGKGGQTVATKQVVITAPTGNQAPTANAAANMTSAAISQTVEFDSSGSNDPDGQIVAWSWNFGDGATATGATTTHPYAAAGIYTVTLTVTDNQGATDTDTVVITVSATSNGASLYATYCAGCHLQLGSTNLPSGKDSFDIQLAIAQNRGGMSMLSFLSSADLNAIAAVLP